jgi:hypothetical protein
MASKQYPAQSPQHQRVAAWVALALALVYPLIVAWNTFTLLSQHLNAGENVVVESLYNGLLYIIWPLPIIAIFLATLVLSDARGRNRVAWAAIILGALSLLTIIIVIAVAFVTNLH